MEKKTEFDDIRPYYDDEVAPTIERLLKDPLIKKAVLYVFPEKDWAQEEKLLRTFSTKHAFQSWFAQDIILESINRTSTEVTYAGLEKVSKTTAYTYISNHRDIVLDAAMLSSQLIVNGFETAENAIGDNLLFIDLIKDLVRLNKSFIVRRNLPMRQMLEASEHLSKYIRYTILNKKQSIWIAQREGRAKNSNDRTQESVLKMMLLGGDKNFLKSLTELNITPITFSYEYDPCDFLKAKEFQQKRDNPDFKKSQKDDLLNMQNGLLGFKGRVHFKIGKSINPSLLKLDNSLGRNELAKETASIIDKEIFLNYKFFPINYIAFDRLWGKNLFRDKYTYEDIKNVEQYFQQQLDKIDLPYKDIPYLKERMAEMYAYPVRNNCETVFDLFNYEL